MESVLKSLEKLRSKAQPKTTGLSVVNVKEVLGWDKSEVRSTMMKGQLIDPFSERLIQTIFNEKNRLIEDFESFFNSEQPSMKSSEVYEQVVKFQIQIERLALIIQPVLSKVTFNKGDKEYDMGKIQWLDDEGNKFRMSRTYGQRGQIGLLIPLQKYIQELVKVDEEFLLHKIQSDYVFDLAVKVNGEFFGIDFQFSNKENFLDSLARLELWNIYKSTYLE